ncbi:MAG: hypothetical protein RIR25_481 [Verrucomicrobiota bacterium]|jgi:hypothetical protein
MGLDTRERAKSLLIAGHSNREVVELTGLSIGTIAGMRHRLRRDGLVKAHENPMNRGLPGSMPRKRRPVGAPIDAPEPKPAQVNVALVRRAPAAPGLRLPVIVTHRLCQWPLWGDREARPQPPRFCGQPVVQGRPYCGGHCARAYRTAEQQSAAA